ncbi:MAG TPA: hypothetical protein ENG63_09270 [Candidatus Desulfofervidus auxilii]|uniref:DUF4015 domain-containing protein n=1 Tax=Desulfofervidus auxilii TaxID=1621989 RepID=A0A7C0Y8D0_DESA2|nr:hypothetical protein [Candidatus Desulfofervidus auxilii]
MTNKILIITIIGLILLLSGLTGWKYFHSKFQGEKEIISSTGTIKYLSLEGGFYGIETEKGEKYLPLNLPEEFKKDGLKVWFKAKLKKVAAIQMWGKPIEILEMSEIGETLKEKPLLTKVKVAVLYERIGDGKQINRSVEDEIKIFKEMNTDFIFRAFWRWFPIPEKCEDLADEEKKELCELKGYSYSHFEESISKIKSELPNVIICGAVGAQFLRETERNPITGEIFDKKETQSMRLNPSKWGINKSLPTKFRNYPDITNPEFQKLLLSWAKKQIDCGADAIWIDMLFKQAKILEELTGDVYHPAVKESYDAASKIVDEIHKYGYQKGKYIYVGTWAYSALTFPYSPPKLDFVTASPSGVEIKKMELNDEKWNFIINITKEKLGDIPILAFIDWAGTTNTPMGVFSQRLSKERQRRFLKYADDYFQKKEIIFVYPVHGGFMGQDAEILSFGKLKVYDSLAPEFQTYETIKNLARDKYGGEHEEK